MISNNSDEEENVRVVTKDVDNGPNSRLVPPTSKKDADNPHAVIRFIQKYPIAFVLIFSLVIIIIVLAIVLPLTLVKPKAERPIKPRCPDGKLQQRVDCLPDKSSLLAAGVSQESACRQRGCCWSATPEGGGLQCAFHVNYGFRQAKVKENSGHGSWFDLTRMEAPSSIARSDIANLEFRLEMHTDYRIRIKVHLS